MNMSYLPLLPFSLSLSLTSIFPLLLTPCPLPLEAV